MGRKVCCLEFVVCDGFSQPGKKKKSTRYGGTRIRTPSFSFPSLRTTRRWRSVIVHPSALSTK